MAFQHTEVPGFRWVSNPNDKYVGKSLQTYGEWSFGEIELLCQYLPDTAHIVEVGGNIGSHTVPLSRHVAHGKVYTFEPQRISYQLLCANVINNNCSNVHAYNVAVGAVAGSALIEDLDPSREFNFGGVSVGNIEKVPTGKEFQGGRVPAVRLDDVISPDQKISLIKCDAEGMEVAVLKGAGDLIERDKPILYLEDDKTELSVALFNTVHTLGYEIWWHSVPLFRQGNPAGETKNIFGQVHSFNLFCCHPDNPFSVSGLRKIDHIRDHPLLSAQK